VPGNLALGYERGADRDRFLGGPAGAVFAAQLPRVAAQKTQQGKAAQGGETISCGLLEKEIGNQVDFSKYGRPYDWSNYGRP